MEKYTLINMLCTCLIIVSIAIYDILTLSRNDRLVETDVIIMLGGEGRSERTAQLYMEGFANQIIVTPEKHFMNTNSLVELGVPENSIIQEYYATSTYTNAVNSLNIMARHSLESAIVVTNDYHLRRSILSFNRANVYGYKTYFAPAFGTDGARWFELNNSSEIWISEFIKILGYRFRLYNYFDS